MGGGGQRGLDGELEGVLVGVVEGVSGSSRGC